MFDISGSKLASSGSHASLHERAFIFIGKLG